MEEIWNDFRKAVAEAEKKGLRPVRQERNETELDRAVNHYKQEKDKRERLARFMSL